MIVSNASSVSPAYVDNVSGALSAQIGQGSGVSVGVLAATGQILQAQIANISGQSIIDGILSVTTNGPATRILVDTYNNVNSFGSSYRGRRARGTIDLPSGVLKDDVFMQLVGDGFNGTGFSNAKVSAVFFAAEQWTTGANGTYIAFRTTPTGSTVVIERVRIADNGNVGIGNTNPQYTLDISGSANFTQGIYSNGVAIITGGLQVFSTAVPTGIDTLFVAYPQSFASLPTVAPVSASTGNICYAVAAQSVTLSGYTVLLSDVVLEGGVTVTTLAKV